MKLLLSIGIGAQIASVLAFVAAWHVHQLDLLTAQRQAGQLFFDVPYTAWVTPNDPSRRYSVLEGQGWVDTSQRPPMRKRWKNGAWVNDPPRS